MAGEPPPARTRRRRRLTDEERALWEKVAATIAPLAGRPAVAPPPPEPEPLPPPETASVPPPAAAPPPPVRKAGPPPPATLDRRSTQKLGRGAVAIEARLDLHGLTQEAARRRLLDFLGVAQARGDRTVLVITGKGASADADPLAAGRGVLRRVVPVWLADPAFRAFVVAFAEARPQHGGAGALYVRLRAARTR